MLEILKCKNNLNAFPRRWPCDRPMPFRWWANSFLKQKLPKRRPKNRSMWKLGKNLKWVFFIDRISKVIVLKVIKIITLCPVYLRSGIQFMVGGPFKLDMIRFVCCRSLFVWDLKSFVFVVLNLSYIMFKWRSISRCFDRSIFWITNSVELVEAYSLQFYAIQITSYLLNFYY